MALDAKVQLAKALDLLARCQAGRFYGTVEVIFQNGVIVRFVKTESIKLDETISATEPYTEG